MPQVWGLVGDEKLNEYDERFREGIEFCAKSFGGSLDARGIRYVDVELASCQVPKKMSCVRAKASLNVSKNCWVSMTTVQSARNTDGQIWIV